MKRSSLPKPPVSQEREASNETPGPPNERPLLPLSAAEARKLQQNVENTLIAIGPDDSPFVQQLRAKRTARIIGKHLRRLVRVMYGGPLG
tara:strand:+ start:245 stop:514 length:270 start_codon:yes stop_codon:yes gene_type:complete